MIQQPVAAGTQINLTAAGETWIYIYTYLIFNPFGCVLKILLPEQHNPIAVPGRGKVL
jgi:hypothetical protein